MLVLFYLASIAMLILAPWAGSRLQRRLWRPLPPIGGAQVIPFRRNKNS